MAEQSARVEEWDPESAMSAMLAKTGVIREDVYNKGLNSYTLRVQSGGFKRYPLLHGSFMLGGAMAAGVGIGLATSGPFPGGIFGLFVGSQVGMKAGDKAAELLSRFAQGQVRIVAKPWAGSFLQDDAHDRSAEDLKAAVQAIIGQEISLSEQALWAMLHSLNGLLDSPHEITREDAKVTILMLEITRRGLHHNVNVIVH